MACKPSSPGLRALLALAVLAAPAEGHGRLTVPRARNAGDNGAVGGGPGAVHAFDGAGAHSKYVHGICGNAAGAPQAYNKAGEVQGTYVAGSTAEFKVVITAHHVGFFEFELCPDASALSESCFTEHRLLKEGCECSCPGDATNSCPECDTCRRWWKPLLEGELNQVVTRGYAGPRLSGQGNLVPYEYTMRYVVPSGLKTSQAVLRWHYMTTNSCTGKTSAPEEFWNCADVAVSDASGDVGAELPFDNAALENLLVEDLMPAIDSGELTGVNAACPEDAEGNLLGVGSASEYEGLCGSMSDGAYDSCVDLSSGGSGSADCSSPPARGILCESECSSSWFQCHNGVAYTKTVPVGTKCKGNEFVLEAACEGYVAPEPEAEPEAEPEPEPETSPAPTSASTTATLPAATSEPAATTEAPTSPSTQAPTQAPGPAPAPSVSCVPIDDCSAHAWCDQAKYVTVCAEGGRAGQCPQPFCREEAAATQAPTQAPTQMPTDMPTQAPTQAPTQMPTDMPTLAPTRMPTDMPTLAPTQAPTQLPTQAPVQATTQAPGPSGACGSCVGCLWSSGVCYFDIDASYCSMWSDNVWCSGGSLAQRGAGRAKPRSNFLGTAFIQKSALAELVDKVQPAGEEL